jgi:hypothetical protein
MNRLGEPYLFLTVNTEDLVGSLRPTVSYHFTMNRL